MEKIPNIQAINTKRDWRWWLVLFLLAAFALNGWLRLSESLRLAETLTAIELTIPSALYLQISGGFWGMAFSAALCLHLFPCIPGKKFTAIWAVLYALWLWIERIFISQPGKFPGQVPRLTLYALVCIGLCVYKLAGEKNEH